MLEVAAPRTSAVSIQTQPTTGQAVSLAASRPVATELPATQTVSAPAEAPAVQVDLRDRQAQEQMVRVSLMNEFIERRLEFAPVSREIVYKAIDSRNGEVVQQYPQESILKLREYLARERSDRLEDKPGAPARPHLKRTV